VLTPTDPGSGWLASRGALPRGYLGDVDRTNQTYRTIGEARFVVSGDRAEIDARGRLKLLGRSNMTINSGGEKVYTEEVESVLKGIPGIRDAVVVGRSSTKWGEEVVALLAPDADAQPDLETIRSGCAARLAGYKIPKVFISVDSIVRFENGKPDYEWARSTAETI
jgi:3-oxocholest-4-en-26-oate---CoA ligase